MFGFFNNIEDFTCFSCGFRKEKGKKTTHGGICNDCLNKLKNYNITRRNVKHYTPEQVKAICNPALSANQKIAAFVSSDAPIALRDGEECYYYGKACGGKIKTVTTGYTGGSKGYSLRTMKNFTIHSGGSRGHAIREQVLETSPEGQFVITSCRFVLMTPCYGFDVACNKFDNITHSRKGLILYAGSKSYIVVTSDVKRIVTIIQLLIEAGEEREKEKKESDVTPKTRTRKKTPSNTDTASSADEIRKYKQLADEGIITQEEFETKKKQLLDLQ